MKKFFVLLFLPLLFTGTAFAQHKDAETVGQLIKVVSLLEQSAYTLRSSNNPFYFPDHSISKISAVKTDLRNIYAHMENDELSDAGRAQVEKITGSLAVELFDAIGLPGDLIKEKMQKSITASGLDCSQIRQLCLMDLSVFLFEITINPYIMYLPYFLFVINAFILVSSAALFTILFVLTLTCIG